MQYRVVERATRMHRRTISAGRVPQRVLVNDDGAMGELQNIMDVLTSYQQYDRFVQWIKSGQRRHDGRPVLSDGASPTRPARVGPNGGKRPHKNTSPRPLQATRCISENGERARQFIVEATTRPAAKVVAQRFKINEQYASALIKRKFGPAPTAQDRYVQIRAHLATLKEAPGIKPFMAEFHIGQVAARRLIAERFGAVTK